MRYRILGSTGLRASVIGVGTWQFGGEWGRQFSQTDVDSILDAAAGCGINLIDTAECYGDHLSEGLIGNFLQRRNRSHWIVATKFGHHFNAFMNRDEKFAARHVLKQLEDSLRALRVETIDLYQFHSGTDADFLNRELWGLLQKQKQAGKIRHLGVSILGKGSDLQAREAHGVGAEVLQVIYNRLDRRPEQLYFPHAERDRLGILARVPLASGLLNGKYRQGVSFPKTEFRGSFEPERLRCDLEQVEQIRKAEVPADVPMAQWALAWCLRSPQVSAVIPGCKDADQVRANAEAANLVQESD